MELFTTAARLLDRLADGDGGASSTDLQLVPALLFLGSTLLDEAALHSEGPRRAEWSSVYRSLIATCGSQQRDIDLQSERQASLEDARAMTELKSGAYGEAMASAGAIAAGASPERLALLRTLGHALGTCGQLIDDAADVSPQAPDTSDIVLGKKTVPLVYFLGLTGDRDDWDMLRARFLDRALTPESETDLRTALEESGAIEFTLTLANWYRMKASSILDELDAAGCNTRLLRDFADEPTPVPVAGVSA